MSAVPKGIADTFCENNKKHMQTLCSIAYVFYFLLRQLHECIIHSVRCFPGFVQDFSPSLFMRLRISIYIAVAITPT